MALEAYPLLEAFVTNVQAQNPGVTTDQAVESIRRDFDKLGPYCFAKLHGLLVRNSGEEFAIEFMSAYNEAHPCTY